VSPQTVAPVPIELILDAGDVGDARVRPGGRWVSAIETQPGEKGSSRHLRMWPVRAGGDPGAPVDLLVDPEPAGTGGLSGGVHAWHPNGRHVAVVLRGGGVVVLTIDDDRVVSVLPLPLDPSRTWTGPEFTADGRELHLSADWSEIVGLDTETLESWVFHDGSDFAIDPAGVPGGVSLAWDKPQMSWTESRLQPSVVRPGVSVQQPRRSPDGTAFGWIDDANNWWNVVIEADRRGSRVRLDDASDHAGPVWGPGQRTWCFDGDGSRVAYVRNEDGYGSLWVLDRATGVRSRIALAVHGCLSWEGDVLAAVRSGARTPPQLVAYAAVTSPEGTTTAERVILCDTAHPRWRAAHESVLVEPEVRRTAGGIPWRLHRAPRERGVIVWVHGGPTDQWTVTFRPRITLWLSRGWSVAVPDHRGSSGHGRNFRDALHGAWGIADAADVAEVLDEVREHLAPGRVVLMGGSAGGLTALAVAAARPDDVDGVVVSYPVVDLAEMLRHEDDFEGHYMPTLIGERDPDSPLLAGRGPLGHAADLARTPILVFHGDMDHSVPVVHSERLVDAVRAHRGVIEFVVMAGEGHGFKDPVSLRREYDRTEAFLDSVLSRRRRSRRRDRQGVAPRGFEVARPAE